MTRNPCARFCRQCIQNVDIVYILYTFVYRYKNLIGDLIMVKEQNRTEVVSFRVTKSELEKIKGMADLGEKTVSEWCKQVAIKIASRDHSKEFNLVNLGDRLIIEQLVLLRFLLSTTLGDKELTDDKLKRIIKRANEMKKEKAQELIREFMSEGILEE